MAAASSPSYAAPSIRKLFGRVQYALPRGRTLPHDEWERRHRGILILLWLHVVAIPIFGVAQGYGVRHSLFEGSWSQRLPCWRASARTASCARRSCRPVCSPPLR